MSEVKHLNLNGFKWLGYVSGTFSSIDWVGHNNVNLSDKGGGGHGPSHITTFQGGEGRGLLEHALIRHFRNLGNVLPHTEVGWGSLDTFNALV